MLKESLKYHKDLTDDERHSLIISYVAILDYQRLKYIVFYCVAVVLLLKLYKPFKGDDE